ncbi:MAG TPA: hypothetical protein VF253_05260 [Candidatus Limnocylindrales bacterium]|jgi:hypothetical protein
MAPSKRISGALALLALIVAACGSVTITPPAPTPADITGIATELTTRGLTLGHLVSGDAGCEDPDLIPTAIGFDASGLDQPEPVRLRLYIFRNREAFERLRATVDMCARSYVNDPDGFESVEQSPYVLAAQGPWPPQFKAAIEEALEAAAGNGA